MHLFDVDIPGGTVFKESAVLSAGRQVTVVASGELVFGLGICYDMRFPELARSMTLKGAKLLIYPGAFGPETGPAHWELTLRARAVDNQVFTIGTSPVAVKYSAVARSPPSTAIEFVKPEMSIQLTPASSLSSILQFAQLSDPVVCVIRHLLDY